MRADGAGTFVLAIDPEKLLVGKEGYEAFKEFAESMKQPQLPGRSNFGVISLRHS
jgi:hypothetical protein